jgi:hypothetical protein
MARNDFSLAHRTLRVRNEGGTDEQSWEGKNKKENKVMNNIKRISLMTAISLTVALSSSAVQAGRIPFNGTWVAHEDSTSFPDPENAIGFFTMCNGQGTLTSAELGQFTLYLTALVDLTTGTVPGMGSARLVAANGDSIFAYEGGRRLLTFRMVTLRKCIPLRAAQVSTPTP